MKRQSNTLILALISILALGTLAACKHSGVAVTDRGQIMRINIGGAEDLPDGYTDKLQVEINNRGVANISNVEFTVEIPNELVVVSEKHGDGIDLMPMQTPSGTKLYHYNAGDIGPTHSSKVEFEVRTAFGTMDRTGEIKVTAWQKDVLGDRLVETKMIKLRR